MDNLGENYIGVGCGALIVNDEGRVLLVKRRDDSPIDPGVWSDLGGKVELKEPAVQSIKREVLEETSLEIEVIRRLTFIDKIDPDTGEHWVSLTYLARPIRDEAQVMEPHKHDDMRWFSFEELPNNLAYHTKDAIEVYGKLAHA